MKEIKNVYKGLENKRQIAAVNARKDTTQYRGPIITQNHFNLVVPNIKFSESVVGDYIVSINKGENNSIFFQIEGSLKEVK